MKAQILLAVLVSASMIGCASNKTVASADSKGVNVNLEPVASVSQPLPALQVGQSSVDDHGILGVEVNNGVRITVPFVSLNIPLGKARAELPPKQKE